MQKTHFLFLLTFLLTFLLFFTAATLSAQDQVGKSLPRASLAERFPSQAADAFLDAMQSKNMDLHSVMILKDGKGLYERWFGEHAPTTPHVMWSVSKTWTTMAVGFAVSENRLSVDDKVISLFPDDLPETVSENLAELRVKDLLTMSVGHDNDPTSLVWQKNDQSERWEKLFLAYPIPHKPGTKFVYNSLATYMLSAIVQKVTGEKIIDYLTPRLLEPLGITGAKWDENPNGVNIGGWGLYLKTEDMAKFGQLLLQKGKWNDVQILPEAWVEEATTRKILQDPNVQPEQSTDDWKQGYCYQIWRCRNNGFRADGKDGQFIVILPEKNAVIVLTANLGNMQAELDFVWEHIFPAL